MRGSVLFAAPALLALASAAPSKTAVKGPTRVFARASDASVTGTAAVTSINNQDGVGDGTNAENTYSGDGTVAAGWPAMSAWVSFENMFNNNKANFAASCGNIYNLANDSDDEIGYLYNAIQSVAMTTGVDHRFILAIILNESTGCVRVPTTAAPVSGGTIYNPGLMQDHDGHSTCNTEQYDEYNQGLGVVNPCPQESITGMIMDGTAGTDQGDGLATLINDAQSGGATDSEVFYLAATWYNQGAYNPAVGGDLPAYAQRVASFLMGWLNDGGAGAAGTTSSEDPSPGANIGK